MVGICVVRDCICAACCVINDRNSLMSVELVVGRKEFVGVTAGVTVDTLEYLCGTSAILSISPASSSIDVKLAPPACCRANAERKAALRLHRRGSHIREGISFSLGAGKVFCRRVLTKVGGGECVALRFRHSVYDRCFERVV